jgi:hypothetical protein
MVKVSGVPYEVDIATLEHEATCMRARMDRLEKELEQAHEELLEARVQLRILYDGSETD